MPLCYEETFRVFQFECDPWDRMTPGAVLRRIQEIGTAHCEHLDITEEVYARTHTVFLLSRISLRYNTAPVVGQTVRIQTRAYAMKRALFQRVTTLYNEAGEVLCEADSRWVIVNTRTRHILRRVPEDFPNPFDDENWEEGHPMELPKGMQPQKVANLVASYSLCDRNGHLNNTRYADIVCDALPLETLRKAPVRSMLLLYRSEIPLAQPFALHSATTPEGHYFLGEGEAAKHFEAFVTF